MDLYVSQISILLVLIAHVLVQLVMYMHRHRKSKGGFYFMLLMIATVIWTWTVGLESMSLTIERRVFWSQVSYFGIVAVGPLWLLFTLKYSQYKASVIQAVNKVIWIIPISALFLVVTNNIHYKFWTGYFMVEKGNIFAGVVYERGLLFFIHTAFVYLCLLIGSIILIRYFIKSPIYKNQIVVLIFAILFPWGANFLYVLKFSNIIGGVELTPIAMAFTSSVLIFGVFRYRFLEFIPAAKEKIFSSLKSGVVIVDGRNIIVDFNNFAADIIGSELMIGGEISQTHTTFEKTIDEIIHSKEKTYFHPKLNKWFELQITEINDNEINKAGRVILFYDITKIRESQQEALESEFTLSSVVNFLPDATFVIDTNHRVIIWNESMEKLTGVNKSDVIGKGEYKYAELLYKEERPLAIDIALEDDKESKLNKYYQNEYKVIGDMISAESFLPDISGGIYISILAKPLYNQEGQIIGAIESIRDITEKKNYDSKINEKIDELERLNKIMIAREIKMAEIKDKIEDIEDLQRTSDASNDTSEDKN